MLRLFLVVVLLTDSLRIRSRFRFSPLILVALLLLTAIYIIPFALSSPIRLTSGLISFLPLILLVSCLAQSRVSYSIDNTILKGLISFPLSSVLSFVFCLINEYLWKVGLMPNKFGGALSFYGLLLVTLHFSQYRNSWCFRLRMPRTPLLFQYLTPPSQRGHLKFFFVVGFLIILLGSAGAAFMALIIFLLFCYPCLTSRAKSTHNQTVYFSLLNALSRLSLLFIPVSVLSFILRRKDVLSSVSGRFQFLIILSQLGGVTLLPIRLFGLATNYAQSNFGNSYFVQTPDSLFVSLIVQYGLILTSVIFLALILPFLLFGIKSFSSLISLKFPKISTNSLLGLSMLLALSSL